MFNKLIKFMDSSFVTYIISGLWWFSAWYQYLVMKLPPSEWIFAMCTAILFAIYGLKKDEE